MIASIRIELPLLLQCVYSALDSCIGGRLNCIAIMPVVEKFGCMPHNYHS